MGEACKGSSRRIRLEWQKESDSAYRLADIETGLAERGYTSCIYRRAARNRPLSTREQQGNTIRSRVRVRVAHVFGHQANAMGGKLVRTVGLVRARMKIGMQNLAYNMSRFVHLQNVTPSRTPDEAYAAGVAESGRPDDNQNQA